MYYYRNVNGSILNNFIAQGIYKKTVPKVEDVIWCQEIYKELEDLKVASETQLKKIQPDQLKKIAEGEKTFKQAKNYYDNYDYLDAERLLTELTVQIEKAK